MFAGILSSVYAIVMMVVLLGVLKEAVADQFCSMTTVFLCFVVGVFIVSALLHPQVCKQRGLNKEKKTIKQSINQNKKTKQQQQQHTFKKTGQLIESLNFLDFTSKMFHYIQAKTMLCLFYK